MPYIHTFWSRFLVFNYSFLALLFRMEAVKHFEVNTHSYLSQAYAHWRDWYLWRRQSWEKQGQVVLCCSKMKWVPLRTSNSRDRSTGSAVAAVLDVMSLRTPRRGGPEGQAQGVLASPEDPVIQMRVQKGPCNSVEVTQIEAISASRLVTTP